MALQPDVKLNDVELIDLVFKTEFQGEDSIKNFISTIEIINPSPTSFQLKHHREINSNGEYPFRLSFYVIGHFSGKDLSEADINENLDEFSIPILSKASFIGSFITEQFLGYPVVTPPILEPSE